MKQKLGVSNSFTDYREMLDNIELDAVIAACYPREHFEIANYSMLRGIPIFVEKPPASSLVELKRMTEMAERTGCVTGVGMNYRFASVTARLKSLATDGINMITLRHFANKPQNPLWDETTVMRSFLYAQTIHSVDFLVNLGGVVSDISVANMSSDNTILMTMIIKFEGGAVASIVTGNTSPHFVFDFDAVCNRNCHVSAEMLWKFSTTRVGKAYADNETKKWSDVWTPSPLDSGFNRSGYGGQMAEFLAAARDRRQSSVSFASLTEPYRCLAEIEKAVLGTLDVQTRLIANDFS
jgi:phthalate 4,5-cis-dihydrodiol dehydrogenase